MDAALDRQDLDPDPFAQFRAWYREAVTAGIPRADAMVVATATREGAPSARNVLLKGVDGRGFRFFTNLWSRKGRELAQNARAALVFYWEPLNRQVLVRGTVEPLDREDSEAYWETRPPGSRIAAAISRQSEVVESRAVLEARYGELLAAHPDGKVPLPPSWGGLRVVPEAFEFWQGRENRLHDRFRYKAERGGGWLIERLQP
jgi:pyridoxamine 5'-phosphate oxidase